MSHRRGRAVRCLCRRLTLVSRPIIIVRFVRKPCTIRRAVHPTTATVSTRRRRGGTHVVYVRRVRSTTNTLHRAVTSLFLHPSQCGLPTAVTLLYGGYPPTYVCIHARAYLVIYTCTSLPVVSSFSSHTCRFVVFVCVHQTHHTVEEFVVTSSLARPRCSRASVYSFSPYAYYDL